MNARSLRLGGIVVFVATLALNLLGASYVSTEIDGWTEAAYAEAPEPVYRPHHLFLTVLNHSVYRGFAAAGFHGRSFVPVQALNALCGATAALLLLFWLARYPLSRRAAFVCCGLWSLSYAPWLHARMAETGVTALPLALAAFLLVCPARGAERAPSALRCALAAALLASGALLNFGIVMLVPGLLAAVWLFGGARRVGSLALVLAALFAVGFLPFVGVAFGAGARTPAEFMRWLSERGDAQAFGAGFSPFGLLRALSGISRLAFPASEGEKAIRAIVKGEDIGVGPGAYLSLARNLAALVLIGGGALVGWLRLRRERLGWVSAAAILPSAVFNAFWLGSDPQYWLHVYPFLLPLVAVAATALSERWLGERSGFALGVGACVLLLAVNLPTGPPSPLWPGGDWRWQRAKEIAPRLEARALVLRPGEAASPYEFLPDVRPDAEVFIVNNHVLGDARGEAWLSLVDARIRAAQAEGRPVYFEGLSGRLDARTLGPYSALEGTRGVKRAELRTHLADTFALAPQPEIDPALDRLGSGP